MNAQDGYFLAKREMQETILNRVEILEQKKLKALKEANSELVLLTQTRIDTLNELASFIRNVMLWKNETDAG